MGVCRIKWEKEKVRKAKGRKRWIVARDSTEMAIREREEAEERCVNVTARFTSIPFDEWQEKAYRRHPL